MYNFVTRGLIMAKYYNRFYVELGKLIKEERLKKNLSQDKLAKKLRVAKMTVSRWELGYYSPNSDKLDNLCAALGISREELVFKANERTVQSKKNDVQNILTNEFIRIPLYDEIFQDKVLSEEGLSRFISISSYLLDTSKKYFALKSSYNTYTIKVGDILIFEQTKKYNLNDLVCAFIKNRAYHMPATICDEADFDCIGVLRRIVMDCSRAYNKNS